MEDGEGGEGCKDGMRMRLRLTQGNDTESIGLLYRIIGTLATYIYT